MVPVVKHKISSGPKAEQSLALDPELQGNSFGDSREPPLTKQS